jgi:hypothetical protein
MVDGGAEGGASTVADGSFAPSSEASAATDARDADDWVTLFDGGTTKDWQMSTIRNQPGRDDPGRFAVEAGALVAYPGTDLGLLWCTRPTPANFVLELEWRLGAANDNSGVFVRFPDPETKGYDNTAWVAIHFGFEVQIDETGAPDGAPEHTTGAIYSEKVQALSRIVANPPGTWNRYSIRVDGQTYTVSLNGSQVTTFTSTYAARGLPGTASAPAYVGLQTHTGSVAFRNVRIRALP